LDAIFASEKEKKSRQAPAAPGWNAAGKKSEIEISPGGA